MLGSQEAGYRLLSGQEQLTVGSPLQIITRALSEINTAAVAGLGLFAVHSGVIRGPGGAVAFPAPVRRRKVDTHGRPACWPGSTICRTRP